MDLSRLTDQSIVDLHKAIADALAMDVAASADSRPSAAREYLVWRAQADACEVEMTARSIDFVAIDWRERG